MNRAWLIAGLLSLTAVLGGNGCGRTSLRVDSDFDAGVASRSDTGPLPSVGAVPEESAQEECLHALPLRRSGRLMFVIDRSGSMNRSFAVGVDRWTQVTDTIASALEGAPPAVEIGAKIFPAAVDGCSGRVTPNACDVDDGVDLPPGPGRGPELIELMRATEPCGATPLEAAVRTATRHLARDDTDDTSDTTLVVVTDGAPNCHGALLSTCPFRCPRGTAACVLEHCVDVEESVVALEDARRNGIRSYVVGVAIDRSEAYQRALTDLAFAGGLARAAPAVPYYDVEDVATLEATLTSIVAGTRSCQLELAVDPSEGAALVVTIGDTVLARDETHASGWDRSGERSIELFGSACERAQREPAAVSERGSCE